MSGPLSVSVIIPAHNAAATLADTLESLLAQTCRAWEAVIVDDGSTDGTAGLAGSFAARDPRIRVLTQPKRGVSAARNAGLEAAGCDWVQFLDADDWLRPDHLERMTQVLAQDPSLGGVCCGWAAVAEGGVIINQHHPPAPGDLFQVFARECLLTIHALLVRREVLRRVGGFDPSLKTCEDWDLWQRVARTGLRFGVARELEALYRWRDGSASTDPAQMLRDGLLVLGRGHAADPRVPDPHPAHAQGLPADELPWSNVYVLSWSAGLAIWAGQETRPLVDQLAEGPVPGLDPVVIADNLFWAAARDGAGGWVARWETLSPRVHRFVQELAERLHAPSLTGAILKAMERLILEQVPLEHPLTLGSTQAVPVEVTAPIPDLRPPAGVERVRCRLMLEGLPLGLLDLPVCDGIIPSDVLADAIAADHAWAILGRFFERTLYPTLRLERTPQGVALWRRERCLGECPGVDPSAKNVWQAVHTRLGWTVFLQEVWGQPDWLGAQFYQPAPGVPPPASVSRWRVQAVEVSTPLPATLPVTTAWLLPTVGGVPLGLVPLVAGLRHRPDLAQIRSAITTATAFELCTAAVREALIGRPLTAAPASLRERLQRAAAARPRPTLARRPSRFRPAFVLGRRLPTLYGTSASRRARLPATTAPMLHAVARSSGEPLVQAADADRSLGYVPEQVVPAARAAVPRAGRSADLPAAAAGQTDQLPILMYHRIAPHTTAAGRSYCVTPEAFEAQLRHLREQGYHTIELEDWAEAMRIRRPLPGRAVALTFDDGYQDFLTHAWPLLQRYGFSATVFLVTDAVGGWNHWDQGVTDRCPLMSWLEIRRLQEAGIAFGSHTAGHRPLTSLSVEEIVEQVARPRETLARQLKRPVSSIAYPYGLVDRVIEHVAGACGYLYGVTVHDGLAGLEGRLLALPRRDITGFDTLETFAKKLAPPQVF